MHSNNTDAAHCLHLVAVVQKAMVNGSRESALQELSHKNYYWIVFAATMRPFSVI